MTIEQAKSELMQIYGALSPDKQRAIDTLVKMKPCKDAISRTTAINLVNDVQNNRGFWDYKYYEYLYDHLSTMPSVNPQEPKTGHWVLKRLSPTRVCGEHLKEYECSECYRGIRCTASQLVNYPYCHCGAKMESEEV